LIIYVIIEEDDFYRRTYIMKRSEARESAFLILFESVFSELTIPEIVELAREARAFETNDFAMRLAEGTHEHLPEIDELIQQKSVDWSIERLSKVVLVALRLAIYEILFEEKIPVGVSINEAVELAKKYSTKEDSAFVNGVLSVIAKETESK
jgi:N utilization substance protein B